MKDKEKTNDIYDICLDKKSLYCLRTMGEETCSKCKTFQMYKLGFEEGRKETAELKAIHESDKEAISIIIEKGKELEKENKELKAQVENLKDCSNCKHCNYSNRILAYVCDIGDIIGDTMPAYEHCDKWEMQNGR